MQTTSFEVMFESRVRYWMSSRAYIRLHAATAVAFLWILPINFHRSLLDTLYTSLLATVRHVVVHRENEVGQSREPKLGTRKSSCQLRRIRLQNEVQTSVRGLHVDPVQTRRWWRHPITDLCLKYSFKTCFLNFVFQQCRCCALVTVIGGVNSESVMVENVGLAVVISLISTAIPRIQCTSGSQSAILNSASQPSSCSVNQWDNFFSKKTIHNIHE